MEEDTLSAFIVRKRNILLPVLTRNDAEFNNTGWISKEREIANRDILIECHEENSQGYTLYGTEIPIIFSYPRFLNDTDPKMIACIGVKTRQWEISYARQKSAPKERFLYNGKLITDEKIIAWLENEKNIETMSRVKTWAIQYGEDCKILKEALEEKRLASLDELKERQRMEEEENKQKVKRMVDRRNELVSKYQ